MDTFKAHTTDEVNNGELILNWLKTDQSLDVRLQMTLHPETAAQCSSRVAVHQLSNLWMYP